MISHLRNLIEFNQKMGFAVNTKPTFLNKEDQQQLIRMLREEVDELEVAMEQNDMEKIFDALNDIAYVDVGGAVKHGLDLDRGLHETHRSNMTKDPAIKDENGKVLKGPKYLPPYLGDALKSDVLSYLVYGDPRNYDDDDEA